jgi:hypothetical protein
MNKHAMRFRPKRNSFNAERGRGTHTAEAGDQSALRGKLELSPIQPENDPELLEIFCMILCRRLERKVRIFAFLGYGASKLNDRGAYLTLAPLFNGRASALSSAPLPPESPPRRGRNGPEGRPLLCGGR